MRLALGLIALLVLVAAAVWWLEGKAGHPGEGELQRLEDAREKHRIPPSRAQQPTVAETPRIDLREGAIDWRDEANRARLYAELLEIEEEVRRGTWRSETGDVARLLGASDTDVLGLLELVREESSKGEREPTMALPFLLRGRLSDPVIFPHFWKIYRETLLQHLAGKREFPERTRALLHDLPPARADELLAETLARHPDWITRGFLPPMLESFARASTLVLVAQEFDTIANVRTRAPLLRAVNAVDERDELTPDARALWREKARVTLDHALERSVPDEILLEVASAAAQILGEEPADLLAAKLPPSSTAPRLREQLERCLARLRGKTR